LENTDYELVKQCLAGSSDSFSELVARYKKLIYSAVYNMVSDKEEADDISQEVFLKIYKALDRYNPEYKFSTWSVKIATNYCVDILRKKKYDSVPLEEIEATCASRDTPEARYISKEKRERIRKAVNELPEKYKVLIIMFHENGLSYDEMSKILNEPMTIIKNRLYRARLMLKDKLSAEREEGTL